MDELRPLLCNAIIRANFAHAEVIALRQTLLQTEEQKASFKEKHSVQLKKVFDELEATLGAQVVKDSVSILKGKGLL